jgi:hypothetical protein
MPFASIREICSPIAGRLPANCSSPLARLPSGVVIIVHDDGSLAGTDDDEKNEQYDLQSDLAEVSNPFATEGPG